MTPEQDEKWRSIIDPIIKKTIQIEDKARKLTAEIEDLDIEANRLKATADFYVAAYKAGTDPMIAKLAFDGGDNA